jgi:hypothetical protein
LAQLILKEPGLFKSGALPAHDLDRQLRLYAEREITLQAAVHEWVAVGDNGTPRYLSDLVNGFGGTVDGDTLLARVLEIAAV